jgi:antitoxin VapB
MGIAITLNNSGTEQSVFIPEEMKINDDKVYLKKNGNTIYIIPFHNPWQNLIESVDSFTTDFLETRSQPESQQRESFD